MSISTAALADASLRLGVPVQHAPADLVPLVAGAHYSGPGRAVTHFGSVDVILETIDDSPPGAVLVVDNAGRHDEACVGDLLMLEATLAGLAGVVIWGRHRDTAQLRDIGLPLHSLGAFAYGPRRVPSSGSSMRTAFLAGVAVSDTDWIVGDDDGVLVFAARHLDELMRVAGDIQSTETAQAERMRGGASLRDQLDFAGYRSRQAADPTLTLRQHLRERGGAIEV